MRIPSGKTDQNLYFVAVDATDLKTRETGLSSFTVYRSHNGAAEVAMTTPTIVEIDATNMPGVYALLLDEDTTIAAASDSEEMCLHITHAGMAPVTRTVELYRRDTATGTTSIAQTGDSFARLGAPAGASVSADVAAVKTQTAAIETDTQDIQTRLPAALVSGRMDASVGAMAANVLTAAATHSDFGAEIADAVLSRNVSNVEGSAGEHTLCTVVLGMLEYSVSGTTWTIKRTDGTTTHASKTLTTNASAEPVTAVA